MTLSSRRRRGTLHGGRRREGGDQIGGDLGSIDEA